MSKCCKDEECKEEFLPLELMNPFGKCKTIYYLVIIIILLFIIFVLVFF